MKKRCSTILDHGNPYNHIVYLHLPYIAPGEVAYNSHLSGERLRSDIVCMTVHCFADKIMILYKDGNLVGDIKTAFLTDVLDPVDKLARNAFVTQFIGNGDVESNGKFAFVCNLPTGDIL